MRSGRRKKGFSVLHLSERSGVFRGVIEHIENGSPSYVPSEATRRFLRRP